MQSKEKSTEELKSILKQFDKIIGREYKGLDNPDDKEFFEQLGHKTDNYEEAEGRYLDDAMSRDIASQNAQNELY